MTRMTKVLDAWPESTDEMLALIESFDGLQKKYVREYALKLRVFGALTVQAEIDAVVNAENKLGAAAELFARKLDFWS